MTNLALVLLKIFEGFRPIPYVDSAGYGTIGYGHKILPGEDWSKGLSPRQAEELLRVDFAEHRACVVEYLDGLPGVMEWELEAMSSLCFNIGGPRFKGSTLLVLYKDGEKRMAAWEFPKWRKAGGKVEPGLIKRRHIESVWFLGASEETLMDFVRM